MFIFIFILPKQQMHICPKKTKKNKRPIERLTEISNTQNTQHTCLTSIFLLQSSSDTFYYIYFKLKANWLSHFKNKKLFAIINSN